MSAQLDAIKSRLKLPVISAPMFLVSGVDLVIACCKAGIMGSMPVTNARTIEDLKAVFEKISTELTDADAPYAMNMITHSSYQRLDQELELIQEYKPGIVITALGSPGRVTEQVHSYGGLVFADANSPDFARKAIDKGADGLVLVCNGAGGHTGMISPFAFVDEVRSFFDGPIALAGAMSNGTAIRASETLGADFAYMGTRFIPAAESNAQDGYRKMIWEATANDLVMSAAISGVPANWLKASVEAAGYTPEMLASARKIDFSEERLSDAKAWKDVWSAGQGVVGITEPETTAEIVAKLHSEYVAAVTLTANPRYL